MDSNIRAAASACKVRILHSEVLWSGEGIDNFFQSVSEPFSFPHQEATKTWRERKVFLTLLSFIMTQKG